MGVSVKDRKANGIVTITYKISEDRTQLSFTGINFPWRIANTKGNPLETDDEMLYSYFTGWLMNLYHNFIQEHEPLQKVIPSKEKD